MTPSNEMLRLKEELNYWIDILISPDSYKSKKLDAIKNINKLIPGIIQIALEE